MNGTTRTNKHTAAFLSAVGVIASLLAVVVVYPRLGGTQSVSKNTRLKPERALQIKRTQELVQQAQEARNRGDLSSAESLYKKAIQVDPKRAFAWWGLAEVLDAEGKAAEAQEAYKTLVEPHSDWGSSLESDSTVLIRFAELSALTHRQSDLEFACQKILEKGAPALSKSLPVVMNDATSAASLTAKAHVIAGIQFYKRGEYDEALSQYERAIESDPSDAIAHFYLGHVLAHHGSAAADAKREFSTAKSLDSTDTRLQAAIEQEMSRLKLIGG